MSLCHAILVVEDAGVLAVIERDLTEAGYRPKPYPTGQHAHTHRDWRGAMLMFAVDTPHYKDQAAHLLGGAMVKIIEARKLTVYGGVIYVENVPVNVAILPRIKGRPHEATAYDTLLE